MLHQLALILLLARAPAEPAQAVADPRVKPGARFVVPFPTLPQTLGSKASELHVFIPKKYDPRRKHPLFVWLNGGEGNPGINTGPVGEDHFVVISMPLYKVSGKGAVAVLDPDGELIWSCYRTMLAELERIVPNVHPEARVIGGFSNGANTTAVLLNQIKEFPDHFKGYLLWEGGNMLVPSKTLAGDSLFVLYGETSLGKQGESIASAATRAGADAEFSEMKGVGHDAPARFHPDIRSWIDRKVLYKELPDHMRVLQDSVKKGRWPDAVRLHGLVRGVLIDDARSEIKAAQEAFEKISAAGDEASRKLPGPEPSRATLEKWKKFVEDWQGFPCSGNPRDACEKWASGELKEILNQPDSSRGKALRKFADAWTGFQARSAALAALDEIGAGALEAILTGQKGAALVSQLQKFAREYDGTSSAARALAKLQEIRETQAAAILERIKAIPGAPDRKRAMQDFLQAFEGTRAATEARRLLQP